MLLESLLEPAVAVSVVTWLCSLVIFGLAVQGYRRNRSTPLLALGSGVLTLTLLDSLPFAILARYLDPRMVAAVAQVPQLLGLGLILVAILLVRRE